MQKQLFSYLCLSAFMCSGGAAGGWAITYKLAGDDAASSFLMFAVFTVLALLILQILFALIGMKRVKYLIIFNILFIFSIAWFFLCVVLPLLWMSSIGIFEKLFLALFSIGLWIVNVGRGVKLLDSKWRCLEDDLLNRYYKREQARLDWSGVVGTLKMPISIYLPGIPSSVQPIISVFIVASMLLGLSVRNIFPTFSVFAWGIPAIIVISLVMQMVGFGVSQFLKVHSLERKDGVMIEPRTLSN